MVLAETFHGLDPLSRGETNIFQGSPLLLQVWLMDHIKYIISNAMCYTMLCMLEWTRKGKHRIGTPRTRDLRGSALMAYIHGGIP